MSLLDKIREWLRIGRRLNLLRCDRRRRMSSAGPVVQSSGRGPTPPTALL